jgi:hypothetical protein
MFAIIGLDRLGPTCDPAFGGGKAHAGAVSDEDVRPVLCFPGGRRPSGANTARCLPAD